MKSPTIAITSFEDFMLFLNKKNATTNTTPAADLIKIMGEDGGYLISPLQLRWHMQDCFFHYFDKDGEVKSPFKTAGRWLKRARDYGVVAPEDSVLRGDTPPPRKYRPISDL